MTDRFVVHLPFDAAGQREAEDIAVAIADALGVIVPSIAKAETTVSHNGDEPHRLFCAVERCLLRAGHTGQCVRLDWPISRAS